MALEKQSTVTIMQVWPSDFGRTMMMTGYDHGLCGDRKFESF